MTELIWTIIIFLIVWRFTYDFTRLDGPFGIYGKIRQWAKADQHPSWLQEGIDCPYCISFYSGWICFPFLPFPTGISILLILAGSGLFSLCLTFFRSYYAIELFD